MPCGAHSWDCPTNCRYLFSTEPFTNHIFFHALNAALHLKLLVIAATVKSLQRLRWVLDAFANLQKATISFVIFLRLYLSVCLPARPSAWNNSAPTRRIFMKFDIWSFSKSVEKIQVPLKSDYNNRYYTWRPMYIYISISSSYNEKCFGQKLQKNSKRAFYVQ